MWFLCLASWCNIVFSRFIHVVPCVSTSFIFVAEYYPIIWIYHSFVYPFFLLMGSCFISAFLAVMSNAALNIHVPVFVWIPVFNSFGLIPEGELLNHVDFFWGTAILFSTVAILFYILTNSARGSSFSTSFLILVIFLFSLDYSHLCRYEMILWILFCIY